MLGDLALPANVVQQEVYLDEQGEQTRILTHTTNSGSSTARGIDLYTRYGDESLNLWGSYSFVDFEYDQGDVESVSPMISRHNFRLGTTWSPIDSLRITPSLVARSTPQYHGDTMGLGDELRDPYEINLHVLYTPIRNLDFFINVRNLTNHKYALRGISSPTPQEETQVKAGLSYSF